MWGMIVAAVVVVLGLFTAWYAVAPALKSIEWKDVIGTVKDVFDYGGAVYEGGEREAAPWRQRMLRDIGEGVEPYLDRAYDMIRGFYERAAGERPVAEPPAAPEAPAEPPGRPGTSPEELPPAHPSSYATAERFRRLVGTFRELIRDDALPKNALEIRKVAATAITLFWNFLGYKLIVFKK